MPGWQAGRKRVVMLRFKLPPGSHVRNCAHLYSLLQPLAIASGHVQIVCCDCQLRRQRRHLGSVLILPTSGCRQLLLQLHHLMLLLTVRLLSCCHLLSELRCGLLMLIPAQTGNTASVQANAKHVTVVLPQGPFRMSPTRQLCGSTASCVSHTCPPGRQRAA
jgi:hypothetical protein